MKFFMYLFVILRVGIGTPSRNPSRAGSVEESRCRSATPQRCYSSIPFNKEHAFTTLPRNFEERKNVFVFNKDFDSSMQKCVKEGKHDGFKQTTFSGMNLFRLIGVKPMII